MRAQACHYSAYLGALSLVLSGCGESPAPAESISVAVAAPFAGGGVMTDARHAWDLVLEQINEGGGVNGRPLEVHERDTPLSHPADLMPVADGFVSLTEQGYKYIISLVSGAALGPMMDAALPEDVLTMSIISEDSALNLPEYDGMLLRGILPTDRLIQKQASALQTAGLQRIAIVGETLAGALDPRHSAMHAAYASCASCSITSVTYPSEADLYRYDWEGVGDAVAAGAPDVIFLVSTSSSALLDIVYWSEALGYTGLYYFAYGGYMAPLVSAFPGSDVVGRFRSYDLALPPSRQLDQFQAAYEDRYAEAFVAEPRLVAFADYLVLLALAMTRVGDADPHAVGAAMREIAGPPGERFGPMDYVAAADAVRAGRDIDFMGFTGPLDFDARGEVSDGFMEQYAIDDTGQISPLP
jgi:ABC-type branched-subunit amino acid transport system substrate-binding protein